MSLSHFREPKLDKKNPSTMVTTRGGIQGTTTGRTWVTTASYPLARTRTRASKGKATVEHLARVDSDSLIEEIPTEPAVKSTNQSVPTSFVPPKKTKKAKRAKLSMADSVNRSSSVELQALPSTESSPLDLVTTTPSSSSLPVATAANTFVAGRCFWQTLILVT